MTDREEIELLNSEYRILQDKIDKIGAFRVTIKGWAVTATVGGLAAIASGKKFPPTIIGLALTGLLLFFFRFERTQVKLGWLFNERARKIEIEIDKLRRRARDNVLFSDDWKLIFPTPNIARSIFGARKRKVLFEKPWKKGRIERTRQWLNGELRLSRSSELFFYSVLIFCSWIPRIPYFHLNPSTDDDTASVTHITKEIFNQDCTKNQENLARPPIQSRKDGKR